MMNIGLVVPQAGYLQALRDACEKHGAALIYDEVKCGGTIAYGGTTERFGVRPHLAAYAKAIGGGATTGAFGGEARYMEWVTKGAAQQGTFNGNPLSAAAGLAALTEVLTKDAYDHLGKLGTMLAEGCKRAMDDNDIPGHTMDLGAKGCVSYRSEPLTNYRDFLETEPEFFYASFSWMINRGHLHDARRRGAVDDLGAAHRGRRAEVRRRVRRASARSSPADARTDPAVPGPALRAGPSALHRRRHDAADARFTEETEQLAQAIEAYARDRIALPAAARPDGLGRGARSARAGQTITPDGIGWEEALRLWADVLAPATISTDHPVGLRVRPRRPDAGASVLFDLVVGASSTIAAGLDRRRRRDLGGEPGAAVARRPGRAPAGAPAASSSPAARPGTSRRWSRPGTRRPSVADGRPEPVADRRERHRAFVA